MSGKPAARQGDPTQCPKDGHGSHSITAGSADVLFNGLPAARLGDPTSCGSTLSGQVIPNVLINGRPAVVMGSTGSHGDVVIGGSGDIFIGGGVSIGAYTSAASSLTGATSAALAGAGRLLRSDGAHPAGIDQQTLQPRDMAYSIEEEEEEDETELPLQQRITLRVGMFFDGTGNNAPNAALTAACRSEDVQDFGEEMLGGVAAFCEAHGYRDTNGDGFFDQMPGTSFGNELSNVALLYDLFKDQSGRNIDSETAQASIKVYIDGIGTQSGSEDSKWGLAQGQGDTGVVQRVQQSPHLLMDKLIQLIGNNPQVVIDKIQFDIFGFSRGAAAARHFANEVLKSGGGVLADHLGQGFTALAPDFDWEASVSINFVGLFDTVAAVGDLFRGDIRVGDSRNPGVNLYLPPGCARKVVHLTAADEHRHNFSLNRVDPAHEELVLPGVHSNLGGGYPVRVRERLLVSRPRVFRAGYYPLDSIDRQKLQTSMAWRARAEDEQRLRQLGLPGAGEFIAEVHPVNRYYSSGSLAAPDMLLTLGLDREVRGELSRVALRVMHAKGVQHGVPFGAIDDDDQRFKVPSDLQPIAAKVMDAALAGQNAMLDEVEKRFLHSRYIHTSANWVPTFGFMVNKPRANYVRAIYDDIPQRGYPA
ncbi:MAG: type IV secretion protein Rhs [Gammaproteobacteria bacterium HGW-Gammaproteobacteria-11]|nr:MAG: type IV secretion protein Rhs [Gammaproteobacteria bacterium HGW-Gammaproteobacteria-11]